MQNHLKRCTTCSQEHSTPLKFYFPADYRSVAIPLESEHGIQLCGRLSDDSSIALIGLRGSLQPQLQSSWYGLASLATVPPHLGCSPADQSALQQYCGAGGLSVRSGMSLGQLQQLSEQLMAANGQKVAVHKISGDCAQQLEQQLHQDLSRLARQALIVNLARNLDGFVTGHFSPVGGYLPEQSMVLILDVAAQRIDHHWLPLPYLVNAICSFTSQGVPRGYLCLRDVTAT